MDGKAISFQDLNVYKRLYAAMLLVMKEVLPKLPSEEKFDLINQLSLANFPLEFPSLDGRGWGRGKRCFTCTGQKVPNSRNQMRRCCKSSLAIIAEGYARKNYKKDWLKYINEAIGECNEMIAHLSCCRDLYPDKISINATNKLIEEYDISGKQLYRLGESWGKNKEGV